MNFKNLVPAPFRKDRLVIPVVRLSGMIAPASTTLRPALSLATAAGPLKRAFDVKQAPVVAISVNSPGGSPVQSRLIYQRIRGLAELRKKRVLVFIEDVAASGGYMLALAGDEIIADETSIVGSIGVVTAGFGFTEALRKIGVERRLYTAGRNKAILDPFQPERESDVEHLKSLQLEIHQVFIDMVRRTRGEKLAASDEIFSGLFWTGARARELGLIDTCGLMNAVISERYGEQARLRLVQAKRSLFGRPQPGVGAIFGGSSGPAGLASESGAAFAGYLPASVIEALEERALWSRFGL
jgi:signal peptide peptidase SppA